jgi:hypothetical protein
MVQACSIVTVTRQHTAVVRAEVPFAEIPAAQRASRAKLAAVLPALDAGSLGRTCTRWRPPAAGKLDMEIGTIVARTFAASRVPGGEVVPSELPAGRAALFVMRGPFDGLPGAWQTLFQWCEAEKLKPAGINWEIYGSSEGVDPAQQETELYVLLA